MNDNSQRAYPLFWPEGWPRTMPENRKLARFDDRSVFQARRVLIEEIRRFGGRDLIISSNLKLNMDGTPRSKQVQPDDRGVAIYFERKGRPHSMACDTYRTVEDNLWALCRTLMALRQIERDGSPSLIERAFMGFAALPDPDKKEWWEVLHISPEAEEEEIMLSFRKLAKRYHPDAGEGSDAAMFDQVVKARDRALEARQHV